MKKLMIVSAFLLSLFSLTQTQANAQENSELRASAYSTGVVQQIISEEKIPFEGSNYYIQTLKIYDKSTGQEFEVSAGTEYQPLPESQRYDVGDEIVHANMPVPTGEEHMIVDALRLPLLMWLLIGFFVLVFVVSGFQGIFSIAGMFISLAALGLYIVPAILNGQNPFVVSLIGCGFIALTTVYLAHGWKRQTHIALFSMWITLCAVAVLSTVVVALGRFTGLGSEEASFLQLGSTASINLRGILLGGILLGTLGVLDDITVSQAAIVAELKRANPKLEFRELYERGMKVGKDHVASLVNTLVLAYAGANLPLFLLFTLNKQMPWWLALNGELLAEEIIRTLAGSIGLVLAVPLTTLISAYFAKHVAGEKIEHAHKH